MKPVVIISQVTSAEYHKVYSILSDVCVHEDELIKIRQDQEKLSLGRDRTTREAAPMDGSNPVMKYIPNQVEAIPVRSSQADMEVTHVAMVEDLEREQDVTKKGGSTSHLTTTTEQTEEKIAERRSSDPVVPGNESLREEILAVHKGSDHATERIPSISSIARLDLSSERIREVYTDILIQRVLPEGTWSNLPTFGIESYQHYSEFSWTS